MVDGLTDYPINIDGRQTYQDSQFRTWSLGNIAADPTNVDHLAVVWSDMRNGAATDSDPYNTATNSDIIVSQSFDGGQTWSAPTAIVAPGDQFMPCRVCKSSSKSPFLENEQVRKAAVQPARWLESFHHHRSPAAQTEGFASD